MHGRRALWNGDCIQATVGSARLLYEGLLSVGRAACLWIGIALFFCSSLAFKIVSEERTLRPSRFLETLFNSCKDILRSNVPAKPVGTERLIARDHVVWAYRILLDREPESEVAILEKLQAWKTTEELRADFLTSPEFRLANPDFALTNERNIVIKEFDGPLRLFIDLSDHVIGLNIIRGRYERSEIEFVRENLKPGQTVLDIGANIGFFAIVMGSIVGPAGRVYAFEPLDHNADLLERSISENGFEDRVEVKRCAVGETSGFARLLFMEGEHALNSGGAYLYREGMEIPEGHRIHEVEMVSLDQCALRRPIAMIKIDVEGAESLALGGAKKILQTDRPIVLSELNPIMLERISGCTAFRLIDDMRAYGYDCYSLESGKLVGRITDVNDSSIRSVVFLPREIGHKAGSVSPPRNYGE